MFWCSSFLLLLILLLLLLLRYMGEPVGRAMRSMTPIFIFRLSPSSQQSHDIPPDVYHYSKRKTKKTTWLSPREQKPRPRISWRNTEMPFLDEKIKMKKSTKNPSHTARQSVINWVALSSFAAVDGAVTGLMGCHDDKKKKSEVFVNKKEIRRSSGWVDRETRVRPSLFFLFGENITTRYVGWPPWWDNERRRTRHHWPTISLRSTLAPAGPAPFILVPSIAALKFLRFKSCAIVQGRNK